MPVEIRTPDPRHYARHVIQNHTPLPLIRLQTPAERWRRRWRGLWHVLVLAMGALSAMTVYHILERL